MKRNSYFRLCKEPFIKPIFFLDRNSLWYPKAKTVFKCITVSKIKFAALFYWRVNLLFLILIRFFSAFATLASSKSTGIWNHPSRAGRNGRNYSYRACLFSCLYRNEPGHHTPGERDEDLVLSENKEDICLKHDLLGERTCKDINGALQHESSRDKRAVFNGVVTSKKLSETTSRSKIDIPNPSLEIVSLSNVEDTQQVQCFEMRIFDLYGKQEHCMQKIESHLPESLCSVELSAHPLTEPYGTKQFAGGNGLKDIHHTVLTSGYFDSTQGSVQFGDGADTMLEVSPSSIRDETKTTIRKEVYRVLAARPLTAFQLRKRLIGKHFLPEMVEAIITDLQASGIQSDSEYAELFSRSRWLNLSWGPKKIKSALMQRGVSKADAERALRHIFNDTDARDEDKSWGMSDSAKKHLMAQATKKWLQGRNVSFQTRKTRMVWWLQYRGFNWDVINSALKELQTNYPIQKTEEDFSDLS